MDPLVPRLELFCLDIIFNLDFSAWHTFSGKYREIDHKP